MNYLYIVMYHYTRDLINSRYPKIKGLDLPLFKKQIKFFEHNFRVVTVEQVQEAIYGGGALPDKALLLTFDDGYIDNYTVAMPILKEHRMQGAFFVPGKTIAENVLLDVNKLHFILASAPEKCLFKEMLNRLDYYRGTEFDYPDNASLYKEHALDDRFDSREITFVKQMLQTVLPERLRNIISSELFEEYVGIPEEIFARELYMNFDQLRLMKNVGMHIGFHGYDHYWLANLTEEEMHQDIDKALDVLDEFIDRNNWIINYPYGNCNQAVCDYARKKGAKLGFTTEVRIAKIGMDDTLQLPRLDCNDFPPKSENWRAI